MAQLQIAGFETPDSKTEESQVGVNPSFHFARMSALAYLYDHHSDLPAWVQRLTKRQLEHVADLMAKWQLPVQNHSILPMEEIERREVLRVLAVCDGSISKAAELLKMGKTTIHRKLSEWGYPNQSRILVEQSSDLSPRREPPAKES